MAYEFKHKRLVEFAETDMAGIVHFSSYFRFMEEAEHAFLRSMGLCVHTPREGFHIGFPRLAARCEYLRPLRFEDEVETHLWVRRKGKRSITYHLTMSARGEAVARGEIVVICCRCHPDGRIEAAPLPAEFDSRIEEAPLPPIRFGPDRPGPELQAPAQE